MQEGYAGVPSTLYRHWNYCSQGNSQFLILVQVTIYGYAMHIMPKSSSCTVIEYLNFVEKLGARNDNSTTARSSGLKGQTHLNYRAMRA